MANFSYDEEPDEEVPNSFEKTTVIGDGEIPERTEDIPLAPTHVTVKPKDGIYNLLCAIIRLGCYHLYGYTYSRYYTDQDDENKSYEAEVKLYIVKENEYIIDVNHVYGNRSELNKWFETLVKEFDGEFTGLLIIPRELPADFVGIPVP